MKNTTKRKIGLSYVIFFCFGLIVIIVQFALMYSKIQDSHNWPTVEGVIVHSSIEEGYSENRRGGKTKRTKYYMPDIEYTYSINSIKYSSNDITSLDGGSPTRKEAEYKIINFTVNKKVQVYYNPKDPNVSLLIPGGDHMLAVMFMCIFLFMIFIAIGSVLYAWDRPEKSKE